MIYALLIFNAETGINLASINFSKGLNIEDGTADLMSGVVKAISDFLNELRLGEIRNFETREKNVLVVRSGWIIAALVCDTGSNIDIYNAKLKLIADEFNATTDMSKWHGNTAVFEPATEKARKIIELTPDDVKTYLLSALVTLAENNIKVIGFKIFQGNQDVGGDFKEITDFELASLLQTNMADMFYQNLADLREIIGGNLKADMRDTLMVNYGKFALLRATVFQDIFIVLILDGSVTIAGELPAIYKAIEKLKRF